MTLQEASPDAPHEAIVANKHWLEPSALCPQTGMLIIAIQAWIIRTPQHLILVDTCIGCDKTNHYFDSWHQRTDDSWYLKLLDKGINPEDVDYVFCTHLLWRSLRLEYPACRWPLGAYFPQNKIYHCPKRN